MPVSISTEKWGQRRAWLAGPSNNSHASGAAARSTTSMSLWAWIARRFPPACPRHEEPIAHAELGLVLTCKQAAHLAQVDDGILRGTPRLAVEKLRDRRDGVQLELLGWHRTEASRPPLGHARAMATSSKVTWRNVSIQALHRVEYLDPSQSSLRIVVGGNTFREVLGGDCGFVEADNTGHPLHGHR